YEYNHDNLLNLELIAAYEISKIEAVRHIGDPLNVLKDAIKQKDDIFGNNPKGPKLDAVIERRQKEVEAMRPSLREFLGKKKLFGGYRIEELDLPLFTEKHGKEKAQAERQRIIDAVAGLTFWKRGDADYLSEVEARKAEVGAASLTKAKPINDLFLKVKIELPADLNTVWKEANKHTVATRDRAESNELIPKAIVAQVNVALAQPDPRFRQSRYGSALEVMTRAEFFDPYAKAFYVSRFSQALKSLKPDEVAYLSVSSKVRESAEAILSEMEAEDPAFAAALRGEGNIDAALDAAGENLTDERRAILKSLGALGSTSDEVARGMADNAEAFVDEFPFDVEAETVYSYTPRYKAAVAKLRETGNAALKELPTDDQLVTEEAKREVAAFRENFDRDIADLEGLVAGMEEWRHDKKWGWHETAGAFFFGKKWTNNSRIQDRYGILPMFTGSLIISIIALVVSVPIAVAGAIYVNQIAPFKEQSFLKPTIEFIGAIPSVVLGFLGIVVVGELLTNTSEWAFLEWLPFFPIEARLNMLNAGLLLAFMAIPIIFTLAEDALNNVPQAYRDGSLSLGANRLQTAFRVVLPASLSGIIAAILLGFGRVIGETMVVLLVAGNRIAIPDFSKGLGVITEPSHTMTGIIAQGLGEAAKGSTDYRALFMVGLVLFMITLMINYIGQKILTKYQAK
ncbi:MAG: phosphate ABC transporter permease subunit PstC, partial [Verrucomicrobiota bacterium]